ncbi:SpaA isopeptide-forming pilin-related protein [Serpentinicella alkaliphila]|uniref:Putative repeat protein (TIGR01451 family) n=1 Tax=Serpentinicella alkaliphila TaxID=1734049 RepID=A0A4R2UC17_9FIRM|nr:SpaA isopeptide-forming pilin-related protein [Serpentinicella alkaliphila]QUH27130.1 hypothetical protein HZR23_16300 [Serpentinicella alkaliphila]TCQ05263.1 putative repeat protein (TIGR01451 family) [Serpentinicella alkaliphila]
MSLQKKGLKRLLSFTLMIILILGLIPMEQLVAYADSDIIHFQFITNVEITDEDGNPFLGDVNKDSKLRLQYDFAIPDMETVTGSVYGITAGQKYSFSIPNEIPIKNQLNIPLEDSEGNLFGNVVIDTDNQGTITFTEFATSLSNVSGFFWVYSEFDAEKIGNDGNQDIVFDLGSGQSKVITIPFELEDEEFDIKLEKDGNYDKETNEITWTINVKPETYPIIRELDNVVIKDFIEANQVYIEGSFSIDPEVVGSFNYSEGELSFSFSEPINKTAGEEYIITFKTRPEISGFTENNQTLLFKNQALAEFEYKNNPKTSFSNEAQVDVTSDFIEKYGELSGFDNIDWTVKINNNYFTIENAKITDKLPVGLTLDELSIKVNRSEVTINNTTGPLKYDEANRVLTYEFNTTINEPQTLTYRTKVTDPTAFESNQPKTYTNEALLEGNGVPNDTKIGVGVEVPTSVIEKQALGYNSSNQEITWRITVNSNKIAMSGAVVTDSIQAGLEYVENSFEVRDNDNNIINPITGLTFIGPTAGEHGRGLITYNIPDELTVGKTVTIEFKTRVLDNNIYATNRNTNFTNRATLNYTNGPESISTATQQVRSQVISKRSLGYNYNTREIEWEITINQNKMPLTNVIVKDVIPVGHKYVVGSSTIGNEFITPNYDESSNILTYDVGNINDQKIIKFKTIVEDLSIFEDNKTITVTNTARISANEIPGEVVVTGSRNINNTVVGKKGNYTNGNNYIDWEVTVNQNSLDIENPVLEDVLQEGLFLDTESVKLFKAVRPNNGNLTKGDEIYLTADNIKYDGPSRTFEFHFNQTIDGPYILEFRTDIGDAYRNATFKNTVTFKGSRPTQDSTSSNIVVSFQIGGGGASGTLGSITIEKVDKDTNVKLVGATFQLIDTFGNVLSEKTTNSSGRLTFDRLKFRTYSIKEVSAPEGYVLIGDPYLIVINSSNKDITFTAQNSTIKGSIGFRKIDSQTKEPIEGAEFELFNEFGDSLGITTKSGIDGLVTFTDIPYGSYIIKEISPAEYYKNQVIELKANISEDEQLVYASPVGNSEVLYNVENTINTGNIKLIKVDKVNNEIKLQGALFRLFRLLGEEEILVSEIITDKDGFAIWEYVKYGKLVIREVTPPEGYYLNTSEVQIELSDDVLDGLDTLEIRFENDKIPLGNLVINKIDSYTAKPLQNVEFEIYKADDLELLVKKVVTDEGGKAEVLDLQIGDYVIREVNTPNGYHKLKADQLVTIYDNKATSITIKNDPLRSILVKKVDRNNPTIVLSGAVFTLRNENDEKVGVDLTTGPDGIAIYNLLEFGKYILKEVSAPSGYLLNNSQILITVDAESELIKVIEVENQRKSSGGGTTPPTPEPEPPIEEPETPPPTPEPPIEEPETPPPTPEPIPQFVVPPSPEEGPEVFILIDDEGIPLGKYTKKTISDGEYIYVDDNGIPLGGLNIPKTSDDTPVILWMILMALCLISSGVLFRPKKRRINS